MVPPMDTGRAARAATISLAKRLMSRALQMETQGRWKDANDLYTAALVLRELASGPRGLEGQVSLFPEDN
jgi:hypothetical protein